MKIEKIVCDICGAEDAMAYLFCTDRKPTAAGDMEDEINSIDMCPTCAHNSVISFINSREVPNEVRNALFKYLSARRK